ncbi:DUF2867 domain-containing protein [Streptomyces sp. NPDC002889]|uniref:DUF2867 domain-containing protein n=1 Tax=Streptomyces sp. NPDC002889 TaxID=3364669 RepID=UPI0036CCF17A
MRREHGPAGRRGRRGEQGPPYRRGLPGLSALTTGSSPVPRMLFAVRWKLGELFGWDKLDAGIGARVRTLRDRLPADLRDGPRGPASLRFRSTSVYQTHDEWVSEMANRTVHAVMLIGGVADGAGAARSATAGTGRRAQSSQPRAPARSRGVTSPARPTAGTSGSGRARCAGRP